jgi:hypothetical protein
MSGQSLQENVKVMMAKNYADLFLSGPSAHVPNRAGPKEDPRHKNVCADGHHRHRLDLAVDTKKAISIQVSAMTVRQQAVDFFPPPTLSPPGNSFLRFLYVTQPTREIIKFDFWHFFCKKIFLGKMVLPFAYYVEKKYNLSK